MYTISCTFPFIIEEMKLPILQEIRTNDFELHHLEVLFQKIGVGHVPCYINLESKNKPSTFKALQNIKDTLNKIKIHPRFPYPVYIITKLINNFDDLPLIRDLKELNQYYPQKMKRLQEKEMCLLGKSHISIKKITNHNLYQEHLFIKTQINDQKELRNLAHETGFYCQILKKLRNRP